MSLKPSTISKSFHIETEKFRYFSYKLLYKQEVFQRINIYPVHMIIQLTILNEFWSICLLPQPRWLTLVSCHGQDDSSYYGVIFFQKISASLYMNKNNLFTLVIQQLVRVKTRKGHDYTFSVKWISNNPSVRSVLFLQKDILYKILI